MGERSILSYFKSSNDAAAAKSELSEHRRRDDTAIFLSADPSVSGLTGEMVEGRSFLLTGIAQDEQVGEAVEIIKKHRGYV